MRIERECKVREHVTTTQDGRSSSRAFVMPISQPATEPHFHVIITDAPHGPKAPKRARITLTMEWDDE